MADEQKLAAAEQKISEQAARIKELETPKSVEEEIVRMNKFGQFYARLLRPELEPVEHHSSLVVVVPRPSRRLEVEIDGHVAHDGDHSFAQPYLLGVDLE